MLAKRLFTLGQTFKPKFQFSKDYYKLLGIPRNATQEQINQAYSEKAKQFYPNVSTTSQTIDQQVQYGFQDIVEAYSVLSIQESRLTYDLINKEQPNLVYAADREAYIASQQKSEDGSKPKPGYAAGSYAEERQQWLQYERKRFNVDELGRYRGGLPKKDGAWLRGNSLGLVGSYHKPQLHEDKIRPVRSQQTIDSRVSQQFTVWAQEEKEGKTWQYLHQTAVVDYDYFKFYELRSGWRYFRNIWLLIIAVPWLVTLLHKSNNRSVTEELYRLLQEGKTIEGAIVHGYKVAIGETGTLKLVDSEQERHGHH